MTPMWGLGPAAEPIDIDRRASIAAMTPAEAMYLLGRMDSEGATVGDLALNAVETVAAQFGAECVTLLELRNGSLVPLASYGWAGPLEAGLLDPGSVDHGVRVASAQARLAGVHRDSVLTAELLVRGRPWAVMAVHASGGYDASPEDKWRLGVVAHFLAAAQERELANADLEHLALHDPLTGLPNRTLLVDRLTTSIDGGRGKRALLAVVCIDIDHFTVVNDTLGHAIGDQVLSDAGERLRRALRPGDTPSRYAGDKFVVVCEGLRGEAAVRAEAERLRRSVSGAMVLGGRELVVSASAGIALFAPGCTPDELLREADVAMYRAKDEGRGRVAVYESSFQDRLMSRLDIESDLRQALIHDELTLEYQPVVHLESGRIVGTESLVRWVHPTRGLIGPADFIPVAEDTRLIIPLGQWVLHTACREARQWLDLPRAGGGRPVGVSVNLSARQVGEPDLPKWVEAALNASKLPPDRLTLEITESVVMTDAEAAAVILRRLKDLGVRLSIDDFGTGYSSLSYLKRFPVDNLKIDRSFVRGLGVDPDDSVIVGAIVRLADALGMETVAEGVENEMQAHELHRLGCYYGQGFLYARPESFDSICNRLSDRSEPEDRP